MLLTFWVMIGACAFSIQAQQQYDTVTIIGFAAQLCGMYGNCEDSSYCFYGSAENDSLWTHSVRRFNIQDTNLTVVYDYKDISSYWIYRQCD